MLNWSDKRAMSTHPRIRYYALFTGCFTVFWFLFKLGGIISVPRTLLSTGLDTLLNLGILIATVEWLMPVYFYRARYGRFAALLALLIFLGGATDIVSQLAVEGMSLYSYREHLVRYNQHFFYWFWSDLVGGSFFMLAVVALGGFATRLAFDRVSAQLDVLKNQTNPHFILNALNTIYYSIDASNRPARDLTQRFASLLRYQLYECDTPTVPIEKEAKCIADYIGLQRQRTADSVTIDCAGLDECSGFSIPPHLLIPLVENCFKHVSRFTDRPNFITISARHTDSCFRFETRNSFEPTRSGPDTAPAKPAHSGLGLTLTRKRLHLIPNATLHTGPTDGCFLTILNVKIP